MATEQEIKEQISQQLSRTPFACTSLTRLSGGTANFVYRGTVSPTESIIIKNTRDHSASNPNFKIVVDRCYFEEAILQALHELPPYIKDNITVKTPRLLNFDKKTNTQILEDLPDSVDLKNFLISGVSVGITDSTARTLGRALGSWLRAFHAWGIHNDQRKTKTTVAGNIAMRDLKFYINYTMLIDTIPNFSEILGESREIFENVRDMAAAELENMDESDDYGIIHGDFWTGNVLLPKAPLAKEAKIKVFIVDWELVHVGRRALDLAQMIAELYETKLFKNVDAGVWVIEGFLAGYGPLSDDTALRTAIHVGVHLVCWGSRVSGWGTPEQIEEVVQVGRDLIIHGWKQDRAWFEAGSLGCLFK
ncbi:uncharacterized protein N7511_007622 [Penicillium nucicola]|uniref:uncharacterized protein n=1 Tax=Penicillium nucicola TaxID=1850975 RepID=UPI0025452146|nr:uncharacterized protein N7511_007622 [Penicillium nucicola]KAJ5753469.1 hypothetical protein N7511_007622 [Penicillium nucicola]